MTERRIFIRNWTTEATIGIHPHEQGKKQPLRLNISLFEEDQGVPRTIGEAVDYEAHKKRMGKVISAKHYPLLEELAEALAKAALEDAKVLRTEIEIEKLKIFADVESCGVSLTRTRR